MRHHDISENMCWTIRLYVVAEGMVNDFGFGQRRHFSGYVEFLLLDVHLWTVPMYCAAPHVFENSSMHLLEVM